MNERRSLFLMQDSLYCAPEPTQLTTVLGSCVAVCLWDAVRRCGGMNHYLLPRCNVPERSARYGDVAIGLLIEGMVGLGCRIQDLRAKVFGGAAVLPFGAGADTVGDGNVRIAREVLPRWRIPIVVSRTGGTQGLQLRFDTGTGEALVRGIAPGLVDAARVDAPPLCSALGVNRAHG